MRATHCGTLFFFFQLLILPELLFFLLRFLKFLLVTSVICLEVCIPPTPAPEPPDPAPRHRGRPQGWTGGFQVWEITKKLNFANAGLGMKPS